MTPDLLSNEALEVCLRLPPCPVLDIGSGDGRHAAIFRASGFPITTINLREPADVVGDYMAWAPVSDFGGIWASHVLEHQRNPGAFLDKCRRELRPGGWLAVTVPPGKPEIVGGHVSVWNAGLLLYHLVLAGFDCRRAAVKMYGYNISAIVRKNQRVEPLPTLNNDEGDIERLAHLFPAALQVRQGFNGNIKELNWS